MKVKFAYNTENLCENVDKLIEEVKAETHTLILDGASSFASTAAKNTWPAPLGKAINKELYYRPIKKINDLIFQGRATDLDIIQFKAGKKFKVINTKGKKAGYAFAYTKTMAEAKKASRIETRGLARVMWR